MNDKKRYTILAVSILTGSLFSVFLFKMKRGGSLTSQDWVTIGSIFMISLILIFGVSMIFKNAEKNGMK